MILFVNACVRETSRTKRLAECLLSKMADGKDGADGLNGKGGTGGLNGIDGIDGRDGIEELRLSDLSFPVADEAFLEKRDRLIESEEFYHPLFKPARQFAQADQIVIAAPYWDLSFPAALKQYFEQINVRGVTFMYTPEGIPKGLCRARKLYYVMTAGGTYAPEEFGYGYVKALALSYYGIADCELIKAVGLDIEGADAEGIMRESMHSISIRQDI